MKNLQITIMNQNNNKFVFSFLDMKILLKILAKKELWIRSLYLVCFGCVIWQLNNSLNIFIMKPTTASIELVNSREYPISLTFCKIVFNIHYFDGNFSRHTVGSLKSLFYVDGDHKVDVLTDKMLSYDFLYYLDYPYLCKEIEMPLVSKDKIVLVRQLDVNEDENNNNLHLFIHPPGALYLKEFGFKYPSSSFKLNNGLDNLNDNTKILTESYDIRNDPQMACSDRSFQECVNKEIIKEYNLQFGCTFPIKRYFFHLIKCC